VNIIFHQKFYRLKRIIIKKKEKEKENPAAGE
jgi:hypothetical protein